MFQRWLGICWKRSSFWKAFNKQNTQKCWTHADCNPQKSVIDSVRIRRRFGNFTDYCFIDFDGGSWQECCGKICSAAHVKRAEGICAEFAQDTLETANKDPDFPKKVITGDESWNYDYACDPEAHSSQWKSPRSSRLKKAQQSRRNVKAVLNGIFLIMKMSTTSTLL